MIVLVLDDQDDVRSLVRRALERDGHEVVEASNGRAALQALDKRTVDVALLDVQLPDMSGYEVLAELRTKAADVHVIMLTGAGSEVDRVHGLMSGADDYVVKPFSVRELAARVSAVQRRRPSAPSAIDVGSISIDVQRRSVTVRGEPVELTRREFELLTHLVTHPGEVLSREDLLAAVWGSSAEWQSDATVTEHVRRIRTKVERDPLDPQLILAVRGVGYRFEPDAPVAAPTAESPARLREASVVITADLEIASASQGIAELLGLASPDDLLGRSVFDFVAPRSIAATTARRAAAEVGQWPRPELLALRRADGSEVMVEISSTPIMWNGAPASRATMWPLEGDRSKVRELVTGFRTEVPDAVIVADADLRIQSFNHAAEELYGWREGEVVGRLVTDAITWAGDAETDMAEALVALERDGRWHGEAVHLHRDGTPMRLRSSSSLVYDGAGQAVGVVAVNRPVRVGDHDGAATERSPADVMADEIRGAIDHGELVVHYQPIVRLSDERWVGFEALVRWEHPTLGLLPPSSFLGAAERGDVMVELGQLVLATACEQAARWRASGHRVDMAVNVSSHQLADPSFLDRVAAALGSSGLSADGLWLEVTETSLVKDLDRAKDVLRRIANLGVRVSIDDFGTGWASLTHLRELPVQALKIDRSFVTNVGVDQRDTAIVASIISLGHELDLRVVAEGVELPAQRSSLESLGCDVAQGWLFGRARDAGMIDVDARA